MSSLQHTRTHTVQVNNEHNHPSSAHKDTHKHSLAAHGHVRGKPQCVFTLKHRLSEWLWSPGRAGSFFNKPLKNRQTHIHTTSSSVSPVKSSLCTLIYLITLKFKKGVIVTLLGPSVRLITCTLYRICLSQTMTCLKKKEKEREHVECLLCQRHLAVAAVDFRPILGLSLS